MHASAHPLLRQVLRDIRREASIPRQSRVVVGVSGGADSLALLRALAMLRAQHPLDLVAAYVDHGLRPGETEAERELVRACACALGIPFHGLQVDVLGRAARERLSPEHAAREERYDALRRLAAGVAAAFIAVGHTADDQVENLLLRLLRGAGRRGLSGMRPREDDIVRPLLAVTRTQVLNFLHALEQPHLEDTSNSNLRFWRNRLRREVLPRLEENFDPGFRRALLRSAAILAEEDSLLTELCRQAMPGVLREDNPGSGRWVLDRMALLAQPAALQRRLVEQALWRLGATVRHEHILAVLALARAQSGRSELHLGNGLRVVRLHDDIVCWYPVGQRPWRGRMLPVVDEVFPRENVMAHAETVRDMSPQELREYLRHHRESDYLLVDVRQPGEYAAGHIAGAHLLPLPELGKRLDELPLDRELVLYCRSGRRSQVAGLFLTGSGRYRAAIYNLEGGILGWRGEQLDGMPALRIFDSAGDRASLLFQAMELEKGAWRFYHAVGERFAAAPFAPIMRKLEDAEEGHARLLYGFWRTTQENPPDFADVYAALSGDVLEGGRQVAEVVAQLGAIAASDRILVVEMALSIELAAYDLYRALAQKFAGSELERELLQLAQAEKQHLEFAAEALGGEY